MELQNERIIEIGGLHLKVLSGYVILRMFKDYFKTVSPQVAAYTVASIHICVCVCVLYGVKAPLWTFSNFIIHKEKH